MTTESLGPWSSCDGALALRATSQMHPRQPVHADRWHEPEFGLAAADLWRRRIRGKR